MRAERHSRHRHDVARTHANMLQRWREWLSERGWCGGRREGGGRRPGGELMHSAHHHGTRGAVRCAMCWECCGGSSASASPTSPPLLTRRQSLRRARGRPHAKARAATGNPTPVREDRIGATQGLRAPSGGARAGPQSRPYAVLAHGLRAGGGGARYCMRPDTGPPQRLPAGEEDGRGRREAVGRGGEGRWMEGREGWRGGKRKW